VGLRSAWTNSNPGLYSSWSQSANGGKQILPCLEAGQIAISSSGRLEPETCQGLIKPLYVWRGDMSETWELSQGGHGSLVRQVVSQIVREIAS